MDVPPEVSGAVGGIGGSAGLIAIVKSLWNDFMSSREKESEQKKRDEERKEMQLAINKLSEEIDQHTILDAQTYSTKDDLKSLMDKTQDDLKGLFNYMDKKIDSSSGLINQKLDSTQAMIISLIKDGSRRRGK